MIIFADMKENIDSGCMILFVKAPAVGRVKTRLAESIGDRAALFLYRAFVEDILDAISATDLRLRIFYYPPEDGGLVRRWIGGGPRLFAQQGDDLGARMHDAFCRTAQEGFERIVLAGSDIPEIDESIIKAAFSALETHPAVIGPAEDGGYYLVGLRAESVCRQVFSGIDWGTDRVLDQSLERFGGLGLTAVQMPCLNDIDTVDDLKGLCRRLAARPDLAARLENTEKALRQVRGL